MSIGEILSRRTTDVLRVIEEIIQSDVTVLAGFRTSKLCQLVIPSNSRQGLVPFLEINSTMNSSVAPWATCQHSVTVQNTFPFTDADRDCNFSYH